MENGLDTRIGTTAFAFRGYNITNLGKTPELLAHPVFGPTVKQHLKDAGAICSDILGSKVDLVARVRNRRETSLKTYSHAIGLVIAVELAQLQLLEEHFNVPISKAQMSIGYSLGEVGALVAGGVFSLEDVLTTLIALAGDTVELAADVTMGVLFTRSTALDLSAIEKLCLTITARKKGALAVSSYLSPNTVLLLGQGETIGEFKNEMGDVLKERVHLRKNPHRWPPMHTSLTRQKNIPNRAAVILEGVSTGFQEPKPPVLSCVTGESSYNDFNARDHMIRWIDHPQKLWDVIDKVLASGVETIIHVGPEPNIIPATLNRLSNNVTAQLSSGSWASFGLRAISRIARSRPWLSNMISSDASLLRAPFLEQIILEDWLLEQPIP